MINDLHDIAHTTIAVPDLEEAMEHYAKALGVEWGPILDIGPMPVTLYAEDGSEISEGLREVWTLKGAIDGSGPSLELSSAASGSPAQRVWGVPDGVHRLHHVCYYVDDLIAETNRMLANGYRREVSVSPPDQPVDFMSYVVAPSGMRFELMRSQDKAAMESWLQTGELSFD